LLLVEAKRSENLYKTLIIIIVVVILNFSPYILLRHETEFQVFTVYLAVFIYLWFKGYVLPSTIALALLVSDSLLGLLFVPFYFIHLFKYVHFKKLLGHGLLFVFIAGGTIMPFFIWSPQSFIKSVFVWYQDIYKSSFVPYVKMIKTIGFSLWFFKAGLQRFIQPLQIGLLVGFMVTCIKYLNNRIVIIKLSLFYYLLFIIFNCISWMYMYIPFLVSLAFFIVIDDENKIYG